MKPDRRSIPRERPETRAPARGTELSSAAAESTGEPHIGFTRRERILLRAIALEQALGRAWLRWRYQPRVHFGRNCRVDWRTFVFRGLGELSLGEGTIIERGIHRVLFNLEPGSRVEFGPGVWIQTLNDDCVFSCKAGAEITVGKNCWFSGGLFGASRRISIGEHTLIGYGCMILDSDLHQLDNHSPLEIKPITIGSHVWMPSQVTVLKGVTIGDHTVIATGSLVTADIPDHCLAAGRPAKVIRRLGDRDRVP